MGEMLPGIVYTLCFITSATCAWMLWRTWRRTGAHLLFWSALCFVLLAGNNLFVILDLLVIDHIDFRLVRILLSLGAISVLLFGFIWRTEDGE